MAVKSLLHVHTDYCDGSDSPEAMVAAALRAGFSAIGLLMHSPTDLADDGMPPPARVPLFLEEVGRLKEVYRGQIEIAAGVEWDAVSSIDPSLFDYTVGSVHVVRAPDGAAYYVDETPARLLEAVETGFGGNGEALAAAYFEQLASFVLAVKPTVVGHFDLIRKFNGDGRFFDEASPIYRGAAQKALDKLIADGAVFELNAGVGARSGSELFMPADEWLAYIAERGGRVMLSSDAHSADKLLYRLEEAENRLRQLGFGTVMQWAGGQLSPTAL